MNDADMGEKQPDVEVPSQLDPDGLLISRYLFRELSADEWAQFEARLAADEDFYQWAWLQVQIHRLPITQSDWARIAGPPTSDAAQARRKLTALRPTAVTDDEMRRAVQYFNTIRRATNKLKRATASDKTMVTDDETMTTDDSFDPDGPLHDVDEAEVRGLVERVCYTLGRTVEGQRILPEKTFFRGDRQPPTR